MEKTGDSNDAGRAIRRDCLLAGTTWSGGESSHRRVAATNWKECLHNADAQPYSKCSINLHHSWILRIHGLINAAGAVKGEVEEKSRRWRREPHTFQIHATSRSLPAAAIFDAPLVILSQLLIINTRIVTNSGSCVCRELQSGVLSMMWLSTLFHVTAIHFNTFSSPPLT